MQVARDPLHIATRDGIRKILQLDAKEATHLAEIFDRPTSRSSAEAIVARVDIGAVLHQQLRERAVSAESGMMKRGGAQFIAPMKEFRMGLQDPGDLSFIALLGSLDEFLELVHT